MDAETWSMFKLGVYLWSYVIIMGSLLSPQRPLRTMDMNKADL